MKANIYLKSGQTVTVVMTSDQYDNFLERFSTGKPAYGQVEFSVDFSQFAMIMLLEPYKKDAQ